MTYNRVHERGRKMMTKNIQDNIWRREKWGKYMKCSIQIGVGKVHYYSEIIKM